MAGCEHDTTNLSSISARYSNIQFAILHSYRCNKAAIEMTQVNLLLAISQETDTNKLRQMATIINDRLKTLAQINTSTIKVGDTIKFSDTISPSYLRGLPAKVVAVNRKSVSVKTPNEPQYGRFKGMNKVRLPLVLVDAK